MARSYHPSQPDSRPCGNSALAPLWGNLWVQQANPAAAACLAARSSACRLAGSSGEVQGIYTEEKVAWDLPMYLAWSETEMHYREKTDTSGVSIPPMTLSMNLASRPFVFTLLWHCAFPCVPFVSPLVKLFLRHLGFSERFPTQCFGTVHFWSHRCMNRDIVFSLKKKTSKLSTRSEQHQMLQSVSWKVITLCK